MSVGLNHQSISARDLAVDGRAAVGTISWEHAWCHRHGCTPAQFRRHIFWRALHWRAVPVAPLFLWSEHFSADWELIDRCARARSMSQVREEIEGHRYHPFNRGWLRRSLGLRVSTFRLRRLAREYLPGSNLPLPFTSG